MNRHHQRDGAKALNAEGRGKEEEKNTVSTMDREKECNWNLKERHAEKGDVNDECMSRCSSKKMLLLKY